MPKYEQIRSYITNNQNLTKMALEVDSIETYANKRRFDPSKPNQPFYFGYEENDKIVLGIVSSADHFRVALLVIVY